jgi:putative restriction endonuclease
MNDMKFWLGVTDPRWFRFHKQRQDIEHLIGNRPLEVNFWQPSGRAPFQKLREGELFLFKAKSPVNKIVGFGHYTAFYNMSITEAWSVFEDGNGANNFLDFNSMIRPLIRSDRRSERDVKIGCTVLSDCMFLNEDLWIAQPKDWSPNIVTGKYYDSRSDIGISILESLNLATNSMTRFTSRELIQEYPELETTQSKFLSNDIQPPQYRVSKVRIGQGVFRMKVAEAYKNRCALTGENTLPVLEAAHILPVAESGPNSVDNGLFLRSDFHKLFDIGLVSVTPDLQIKISPSIHDMYFNGKAYYRLNNQPLAVQPTDESHRPSKEYLDWHYKNVFVA